MGLSTNDSPTNDNKIFEEASPNSDDPLMFPIIFGNRQIDKDMMQLVVGVTLFWLFCLIIVLKPPIPSTLFNSFTPELYESIQVDTGAELVDQLKEMGLWKIVSQEEIPPVLIKQYPQNLHQLNTKTRKKAFLHSLLPVAMIARSEIDHERTTLTTILNKIDNKYSKLRFTAVRSRWQKNLTKNEIYFLRFLTKKYRTNKVSKLLLRVNVVPVSLILAQGALESSWGASRFVSEGNNIFGIWTWGEDGMIPSRRDDGKRHKVASYGSILDSVRAYLLMLNRVSAYKHFRTIRQQTMDPLALAEGLLYYSERRKEYVSDITNVIRSNRLKKYDEYILANDLQTKVFHTINLASRKQVKYVNF